MAWTYSDYESQSTDALRLARLRLHKAEVANKIHEDYSVPGRSVQTAHLTNYISVVLDPRIKELESRAGVQSTASQQGTFVRARPI